MSEVVAVEGSTYFRGEHQAVLLPQITRPYLLKLAREVACPLRSSGGFRSLVALRLPEAVNVVFEVPLPDAAQTTDLDRRNRPALQK
jgi:hypothetical protein